MLNINFGLANYGHLAYYNQMGTLLQEKKVLSKEIDRIKIQIEAEDGGGENPAVDNPRYKSLYD